MVTCGDGKGDWHRNTWYSRQTLRCGASPFSPLQQGPRAKEFFTAGMGAQNVC